MPRCPRRVELYPWCPLIPPPSSAGTARSFETRAQHLRQPADHRHRSRSRPPALTAAQSRVPLHSLPEAARGRARAQTELALVDVAELSIADHEATADHGVA